MSVRIVVVLAGSIFSSTVALSQDEKKPAVAADEVDDNAEAVLDVAELPQAVERELKKLKGEAGLSEEQVAGLRLGIQPLVSANRKRARENFLGDQYLGPQIQLAIVNAVRAIAGDNARASAYADDLRLRHDFQR
ncbi:MAG: hypothetical protein AB8G99_17445, partial [Planctomycetaceae bacterium]